MKRNKIRYILLLMVALFSLSACEIETHDNGKLDGFWHLEKVDTIATGGVCNMSQQKAFWSDPTVLQPFGISNVNDNFEVMQLTGSKMMLKSETLRLVFRKF